MQSEADNFHEVWPSQCHIINPRRTIICLWWWTHTHQSLWGSVVPVGEQRNKPPFCEAKNHLWPVSGLSSHWALSNGKSNVSNITGHHEASLLSWHLNPPIVSHSATFTSHPAPSCPALSWPYDSNSVDPPPKWPRPLSTDDRGGNKMNRALTVDKELLLIDSPASFITGTAPFQPACREGGRLIIIPANVIPLRHPRS